MRKRQKRRSELEVEAPITILAASIIVISDETADKENDHGFTDEKNAVIPFVF